MTNEDYKELYDSAKIGLWRTSIDDGKFLTANTAAAQILGFDGVEDLMSHYSSELYDRKQFIVELQEMNEIEDAEVCMSKKDGDPVWVSVSAKIYPEKGYIEGTIRDITSQKQRFLPHLQKISLLKQNIMNRLHQEEYSCKPLKTA